MRRQDVAESAGQARTACPARSVRNPDGAKGPAQRADGLARSAGAGPALTGPARSPAAGEMKLPCYQANETCSAPACAAGKKQLAPWFDGCTSPPAQQAKNNPRRGSTAAPARLRSRQLAAR